MLLAAVALASVTLVVALVPAVVAMAPPRGPSGGPRSVQSVSETPSPAASEAHSPPLMAGGEPCRAETTLSSDAWEVTIHRVTLDADDAVASANVYNPPAQVGFVYILVDVTVRSLRPGGSGDASGIGLSFVTSQGERLDSSSWIAAAPNQLDLFASMYAGGAARGNVALHVPRIDAPEGLIAVTGLSDAVILVAIEGLASRCRE